MYYPINGVCIAYIIIEAHVARTNARTTRTQWGTDQSAVFAVPLSDVGESVEMSQTKGEKM